MQTLNVLAGIAYDPTIRGLLATLVGVVVLMGSVYLILATNTGNRLGFLLALTGFFGWMAIMGSIWWMLGIGMQGAAPSWKVVEYNAADTTQAVNERVHDIDLSPLPTDAEGHVDHEYIEQLFENDQEAFQALNEELKQASNGWEFLDPGNPKRGEAEATVSAALPACDTCNFGIESASDFIVLDAYRVGGKPRRPDDANLLERAGNKITNTLRITHPTHYAVVQVQKVIEQEQVPGEAPPTPVADRDEPVISVVMVRDIGDRRFPSAMITIGSTLIFALLCWILHTREKILEVNLAAAAAAA